jgi:hypothetical protein
MNSKRRFLLADKFQLSDIKERSVLVVDVEHYFLSSDAQREVFVKVYGGDDITFCIANKVDGVTQNISSFERSLSMQEFKELDELGWYKTSKRESYIIATSSDETIEIDVHDDESLPAIAIVSFDSRYFHLPDGQIPELCGKEVTNNLAYEEINFAR